MKLTGGLPVRRSSRDHHGFNAFLPVTLSHPTLTGIKLVISVVSLSILVRTYCHEDRATHGVVPFICIIFQVSTVGSITISSISYLCFSIHYFVFFIPYR
jgi:hypothetical protein